MNHPVRRADTLPVRRLTRALVAALVLLYTASIVYVITQNKAIDFYAYYLTAYGFAHGTDMYALGRWAPNYQSGWAHLATDAGVERYAKPYLYPPLTAALVWPLTALPARGAAALWLASSAAALIASAWLLGRTSRQGSGVPLALALLLGFVPPLVTLYAGQVNAFVLLTLAGALYALDQRRPALAGTAVAVGAMLKLVPIAHLAYLGWRRQRRAVLTGLLALAVCVVIVTPLIGIDGLGSLARYFFARGRPTSVTTAAGNQAFSGFFGRLLIADPNHWYLIDAPMLARWLWWAAALVTVVATATLCWPVADFKRLGRLEFALVTTAVTLVTPYTWYHQLVLLLVPLFVLIDQVLATPHRRWILGPLAIGYVGTDIFGFAWRSLQSPILASIPFYTVVFLWCALAWIIIRTKRARRPAALHRKESALPTATKSHFCLTSVHLR